MNGPRSWMKYGRASVDAFAFQAAAHEIRVRVLTQHAGEGTTRAQAGGGDQGRGRQAAALPFAASDLDLAVRLGKRSDIEQVVHGRTPQAEDIVARMAGIFWHLQSASADGDCWLPTTYEKRTAAAGQQSPPARPMKKNAMRYGRHFAWAWGGVPRERPEP